MGPNISVPDDTRAVLDSVRRIVQALRESSREAQKQLGVSGAQLFVLHKLAESPALSLNQLAARTHTHQSSVSAVVTRLVDAGLVVRARSAADARSVEITLSGRGRRLVARAPGAVQQRLVRAVETLSVRRRRLLAITLAALASAMDGIDRQPEMFFEDGIKAEKKAGRVV